MTGVVTTSGIRNTLDVIQLYLMSVFSKEKKTHLFYLFIYLFALFCGVFLFLLVFVGLHCFQKFNNLRFVRRL